MYIWDIVCKVRWSCQGTEEDGKEEDYSVSALSCYQAMEKVKKIALKSLVPLLMKKRMAQWNDAIQLR